MTHLKHAPDVSRLVDHCAVLQDARDDGVSDCSAGREWLGGEEGGVVGEGEQGEDGCVGCDWGEEEGEEVGCCRCCVQVGTVGIRVLVVW